MFDFVWSPVGDGTYTVQIAAASAEDRAGNSLVASNVLTFKYDTTSPTGTLSSTTNWCTASTPIKMDISWSEPTYDISLSDVTMTGGVVTNLTGTNGSSYYSMDIFPTSNVLDFTPYRWVTANIGAGMITDLAGNPSVETNTLERKWDTHPPNVTLSFACPSSSQRCFSWGGYIKVSPLTITATFNENVTGLEAAEFTLSNSGAMSNFKGIGHLYLFDLSFPAEGNFSVSLLANKAVDCASNGNLASNELFFTYDVTAPTSFLNSTVYTPYTKDSPIPLSVTFSEPVVGFNETDVDVALATRVNFAIMVPYNNYMEWTLDLVPMAEGAVSAQVESSVAIDYAGNANLPSNTLQFIFDTTAPTVVVTSSVGAYTKTSPIPLTFTFSELTYEFSASVVAVSGGTLPSVTKVSDTVYTGSLVPGGHHMQVSVMVPAYKARDSAFNWNVESNVWSSVFDDVNSLISSITSTTPMYTSTSPITVTIQFNEVVVDFEYANVTVTNGEPLDTLAMTSSVSSPVDISPTTLSTGDYFGSSFATHGRYIAVGAPGAADGGTSSAGLVYVYGYFNGGWVQHQAVSSQSTAASANFGTAVAMNGQWLVIGASTDSSTGKVYIYSLNNNMPPPPPKASFDSNYTEAGLGQWAGHSSLTGSGTTYFGADVALAGNELFVSQVSGGSKQVVVYQVNAVSGAWSVKQTALTPTSSNTLGTEGRLAVAGSTLVLSSSNASVSSVSEAGCAFIFIRNPDTNLWVQHQVAAHPTCFVNEFC
ncbi:hypothetical protein CYMTET_5020 [Cymbomonas tetramitiformis]|uniref:Bacterial Ig-like domain-containing protein n=1 Tax=Cymbomonas tetramitiformis TaxID=36881 RepID=A0AAE0H1V6_9CHLO|nr:hypothetical protein CYMTET_5020 [Cymbomonas tetramitiformis]|eukprot:gene2251-2968_t